MPLFPVEDHQLEAVVALVNRAYRGTEGWTHEAAFLDGQRTDIETLRADRAGNREARLLSLREGPDQPLWGVVWLEPSDDDLWYLGMLTVRPDIQDQQLGRLLLAEAETFAFARGARRMRMTVLNLRTPLIAWYERRGYHRTGETQPFPYEDSRFGAPRRDDLAFTVMEKSLTPAEPPALAESAESPP